MAKLSSTNIFGDLTVTGDAKINGIIDEDGNRIVTRDWATNNNIGHSDLSGISSDDHHSKYTDSEAVSAVESVSSLNISGSIKLSAAQNLTPVSEPSAPSNGSKLFVDSDDNNLKSKDSSGSVVTIVTT